MTLEELLKPVKWIDTQVVKGYTKVGERFHLLEGKKKYAMGLFLDFVNAFSTTGPSHRLGLSLLDWCSYFTINFPDQQYNISGLAGEIKDETTSDVNAINPLEYKLRRHNSIMRFPTLLSGVGLVAKFGYDVYQSIREGTSLDQNSYDYLQWGLGQLSLASSMYLKAMDPKLLNKSKQPFWQRVYSSLQEKIRSLAPQPAPVPVPTSYSGLDTAVNTYLLEE